MVCLSSTAAARKLQINGLGVVCRRFRQCEGNADGQIAQQLLGVQGPDLMRRVSPVLLQAGFASSMQILHAKWSVFLLATSILGGPPFTG